MKKLVFLTVAIIFAVAVLAAPQGQRAAAPMFEGKTTLVRPMNYREWVFVGSSLGLRYTQNAAPQRDEIYHNVYITPDAYREFAKTGKFPEGTVLAMELAAAGTKKEPALQGSFEKEFVGLEVSVKDNSRFQGGWAYFNFSSGRGSAYQEKAEPFPASAGCVSCHKQNAETDNVFTQFYPVLREARPK
jgi:cytochrome c553